MKKATFDRELPGEVKEGIRSGLMERKGGHAKEG